MKPPDGEETVDFFTNYSILTKDEIVASMRFYRTYGQDYDLQNLTWSELFLAKCCDGALPANLDERMARYTHQSEQGGPIYSTK